MAGMKDGIKIVKALPRKDKDDWITKQQFSDLAEVSTAAIAINKKSGKFLAETMLFVKVHPNKDPWLYLSKSRCLYPYLADRKLALQPKWYKEEMAGGFKDGIDPEPPENAGNLDIMAPANFSKAAQETIKAIKVNQKLELELQLAQNEVMLKADVIEFIQSVALSFRQGWDSLLPRTASLVAAESNTSRCYNILEKEGHTMMEIIAKVDDYLIEVEGIK